MDNAPVLAVEGLAVRRGARLLHQGLSLELPARGRGRIRGPNGSGKTTLAEILVGLRAPAGGRLRKPTRIGYAPQEPAFPAPLPAGRYLAELAALGRAGAHAREQTTRALRRFDLGPIAPRLIGELSRGWRQRLNLARAFLGEPRLVILDEPQTALDQEGLAALQTVLANFLGAVLILAPAGPACDPLAPLLLDLGSPFPAGAIL